MSQPLLSIIIPTRDRPHLLPHAVQSAIKQTINEIEVIVVDDGSTQPVSLPEHPQLSVIRLSESHGGAGARNCGTEAARGRWITYLDDDDRLLPNMVAVSLAALTKATLPAPVGVISGIEEVNAQGEVISKRIPPPSRPRGCHFSLENLEPGYSYNTKQTLVVEREVIQQIGGWDEAFRSRVHSDLFLRLNPVCSLIGVPIVTYKLFLHIGDRVSVNPTLRQESFDRLINKHQMLFEAHSKMFANFVYEHAYTLYELGQTSTAFSTLCRAMKLHPLHTLRRLLHYWVKGL
ncbi:MAG: glycosyltransferase [Cyanomargarita calcarea GSE-NOS-MK-12-04C]|jgi:glycosyltransferase involved in cell wall biosynthesis|uniref:Glycosyltransferase n=1 Tax=Cyanomargarita calcarea GSE-NOS-MK-12-04C TaxID=2839659 RepID=A0A951QRH4_9CYAN|nr:glycosyltransferase [Cyanomargarita calcarea GSE-NOS-MK-12-04C]